jgi:hypothetical protein
LGAGLRWTFVGLNCHIVINMFMHEIQLVDGLVVGFFEQLDARAACDRICRHFAYESYLLKVWWVKTRDMPPR